MLHCFTRPSVCASLLLCSALAASQAHGNPVVYTTQPGDNPWTIARRLLVRPSLAHQLVQDHGIVDARRIQPGTPLRLPQAWLRHSPDPVQLLSIHGEVRVLAPDGTEHAATEGQSWQAPVRLVTGAQGSASLGFADGSRVLVLRESELIVHEASTRVVDQRGTVLLELLRGRLENEVSPSAAPGRRFEIRMPAAIAAVRGTQFRVQAQGQGAGAQAQTEVVHGAVQFGNHTGQVLAATAQGSVVQPGQPPTAPAALLPAPDLSQLPEVLDPAPAELALPSVAQAAGYRMQLAGSEASAAARLDQVEPAPLLRLPGLADGAYMLRVRAIDANGLEGLPAERRLQVRARPEPPLLLAPAPDGIVGHSRPLFRWTLGPAGSGQRLQLWDAQGMQLLDLDVAEYGHQLQRDLPAGRYSWRVARLDADGRIGPFSGMQHFERVDPALSPRLTAEDDGQWVLRWNPQTDAARYQVQLDRDGSFAVPVLDLQADQARLPLQALAPGRHWVRIRAIDAAGQSSPWSATEHFDMPAPAWPRALWLLLPLVLL